MVETARRHLEVIQSSGQHLLSLINRILDMSKLESGKLELQSAAFDLDLLLSDVRSMFSHAAASKGLALTLERTPALPPLLEGDALRLRQVRQQLQGCCCVAGCCSDGDAMTQHP